MVKSANTPAAVIDAEIVDQPAAIEPQSQRFEVDYSQVDAQILSYEEQIQLPGFMVRGATVVDKGWLLGVPHVVTSATFWTPAAAKNESGLRMGMVSLEATVANADVLQRQISRKRVIERNGSDVRVVSELEELGFFPGERIVYNDESTGIRRTVVDWLIECNLITIPKTPKNYIGNPKDMPWPLWDSFAESAEQGEALVPRFTRMPSGNPFIIHAARGLRVSSYTNDYTEEGLTYYFA